MKDAETDAQTNANYHELNEKANIIYEFVMMKYNNYIKTARDYGTGGIIHMVEVHTLTVIEENLGITVTEVALKWNRTRGALSLNWKNAI
ncbi:hypothetical protein [Bacillus tequilensis]|uniref:hypothetical protein n=1 Tax=Bacillus tequilensis TaxID=227866 RepID=UPI0015776D01|nr:hypothetical protein [Bacillus tequilensis]